MQAVTMGADDGIAEMSVAGGSLSYAVSGLSQLPKGYSVGTGVMHVMKRLGVVGLGIAVGDFIYEVDKEYLGEVLPTTKLGKSLGSKTYDIVSALEEGIANYNRDLEKEVEIRKANTQIQPSGSSVSRL